MLDLKPHGVRRRLFSQGFSRSTILKWEEPIKARDRTAVAKINQDALAGSADILKWWTLMTNGVVCELCFGEGFDALGGEKKPPFVKDFEISIIIGGISAEFKDLIPILYRLPSHPSNASSPSGTVSAPSAKSPSKTPAPRPARRSSSPSLLSRRRPATSHNRHGNHRNCAHIPRVGHLESSRREAEAPSRVRELLKGSAWQGLRDIAVSQQRHRGNTPPVHPHLSESAKNCAR
jgi:hypothetical protein